MISWAASAYFYLHDGRVQPLPGCIDARDAHNVTMSNPAQPCPACGYRVHVQPCGSGATCPVCGWVDDFEQLVHPDLTYGANPGSSLRQAQRRAAELLAAAPERAARVERDPHWRLLRVGETPLPDPEGPSSPVCYLGTPDPADYVPYWRR